jgi:predicted metalloprotease
LLASCAKVVDGRPVSSGNDPNQVAGKPVTETPSGLRPNAPGPARTALNSDGGEMDHLALMAISDIEEFWKSAYGPPLEGKFTPVTALFSYDSPYKEGMVCGESSHHNVNLSFCDDPEAQNCPSADPKECTPAANTIAWDRGVQVPQDRDMFGVMLIAEDLGHEYGHAIQDMADLIHESDDQTAGLVAEQQADCFAGVYLRWIADGKSPRFTMNTGETLDQMVASQLAVRDSLFGESDPYVTEAIHGSGFERITAFQMGFTPTASRHVRPSTGRRSAAAGVTCRQIC